MIAFYPPFFLSGKFSLLWVIVDATKLMAIDVPPPAQWLDLLQWACPSPSLFHYQLRFCLAQWTFNHTEWLITIIPHCPKLQVHHVNGPRVLVNHSNCSALMNWTVVTILLFIQVTRHLREAGRSITSHLTQAIGPAMEYWPELQVSDLCLLIIIIFLSWQVSLDCLSTAHISIPTVSEAKASIAGFPPGLSLVSNAPAWHPGYILLSFFTELAIQAMNLYPEVN